MHRCRITVPNGGVGHHVHDRNEEMFVIFDGAAEFTVDGHTSLLEGPVGVPIHLGQSHAILNPTNRPVEFLNVNVSTVDGQYDASDLDVYYVLGGEGEVRVGLETSALRAGDAVPVLAGEAHSIANGGMQDLELMTGPSAI